MTKSAKANTTTLEAGLAKALARWRANAQAAAARRREVARLEIELRRMSERELTDLGLARDDIARAARKAV